MILDSKTDQRAGTLMLVLNLHEPTPSASGKTLVVATAYGNVPAGVKADGQEVIVHLGIFRHQDPSRHRHRFRPQAREVDARKERLASIRDEHQVSPASRQRTVAPYPRKSMDNLLANRDTSAQLRLIDSISASWSP